MAIEKAAEEKTSDVPEWFMTYSDVITLLMTFFILLLTFATNEPEKFEQMQVSLFGGKGSNGIAKEAEGALEKDSLLIRVRTRASRVTTRGTETPPIHADPEMQSINKGLEALDKELEHELETTRSIMLPLPALVDDQNKLTSFGTAIIKKFSRQLGNAPFTVNFQVVQAGQIDKAVALCEALTQAARMPLGRVGAGVRLDAAKDATLVRIVFTRLWNHD